MKINTNAIIESGMYGTPRAGNIFAAGKKVVKSIKSAAPTPTGGTTTSTIKKFVKGVGGVGRKLTANEW